MHTSDQINAATIADTPRQGGTFRNFYDNHTEFLCASKSTTAAKNIGGDEGAGNDTLTKTKSNIIPIPPFVAAKSSCNFGSAKVERLNAPQRFPTRKVNPSYKQQSNLTPHVSEMSTILNSAVEANLQRPPKISEEMKVPEMILRPKQNHRHS